MTGDEDKCGKTMEKGMKSWKQSRYFKSGEEIRKLSEDRNKSTRNKSQRLSELVQENKEMFMKDRELVLCD